MSIGTIVKALNHQIRRDIIARLQNGPMSAGELASAYDVSKPTMSTHFQTLKDADLITSERDGNTIIYHLNATVAEEAMAAILALLGAKREQSDQSKVPKLSSKEILR